MRPSDYARQAKKQANVALLERIRNQIHHAQAGKEITRNDLVVKKLLTDVPIGISISNQKFLLKGRLPITNHTLRVGVEAVLQTGWRRIKWPNGFSVLHLAAKCEHLQALKFLLHSVEHVLEDVRATDGQGMTPLDYAMAEEHVEEVTEYLRHSEAMTMGPVRKEISIDWQNVLECCTRSLDGDSTCLDFVF
ncbi:unnamed protein product [Amoebophrya sp. A25]|nr:unnamed protein product [Amoebophrya sp. A25]|eukprot:GSA25T00004654001.1